MKPELAQEVFSLIESAALGRPSPMEFEMAYQTRVAVERIRFAIRAMEQAHSVACLDEAGLQLLDALDRLESIDRRFQHRFRSGCLPSDSGAQQSRQGAHSTFSSVTATHEKFHG
jgi:hypothetical protein